MSKNRRPGSNGSGESQGRRSRVFSCLPCANPGNSSYMSTDPQGEDQPKGCTDIVFLALYVLFCLVMIVIGVFAISYGNPLRLVNGIDSFGNICGMKNDPFEHMNFTGLDMSDKPYVFFFDRFHMAESRKTCVKACPDTEVRNLQDLQDLYRNQSISLCQYDFRVELFGNSDSAFTASIAKQLCPKLPYPATIPVLKRCIPKPIPGLDMSEVYGYLNGLDFFRQILGDLALTWHTVLGLSAVAFLISVALMLCAHWMTAFLAYVILIIAALTSIGFTVFLWWVYFDVKQTLDSTPPSQLLEESVKNEIAFLTYSIISTVFMIILLCIIFYLRKRVTWVVKLFREAGLAVKAMPTLLLQPFCTYIILTTFFLIWLLVILCLATADYPTSRYVALFPGFGSKDVGSEISVQKNELPKGFGGMTVIEYSDSAWVKYLWWVYVLGLIWCSEFILACQQMVIASSISTWYFSRDRSNLKCVIFHSILNLARFHLGSMALGALLITLVKVPRLTLAFIQRVLRRWDEWKFVNIISKCCSCCLRCFENCLRMVHHNAYTVIAIQGVNFCPAARLALQALIGNALRLSVINGVGDFVLFLTKVIVAGLTGVIALLTFRNDERLYFYAVPVLITVVFAYFVAHCVISIFEMAVDTLFLCFCEDHNMNDNTDAQNFSAPASLMRYMIEESETGRRMRCGASPIPHKSEPDQGYLAVIGEELMPMKGNSYDVTT